MSVAANGEDLNALIEALEGAGSGGIVYATGFAWNAARTQHLARRTGATTRLVELTDATLTPGGIWLGVARSLGSSGTGDPRRRARRGIAEAMGMRRRTLLVVEQAERLSAPTLASLVVTAAEEPGLQLLLFAAEGGALAAPLPDWSVTAQPPIPKPVREKPVPVPPAKPARATAAAPAIASARPRTRPRAPFRVIAPVAFTIGILSGWLWWQLDPVVPELSTPGPSVAEAPSLPRVAAAPPPTEVETAPTALGNEALAAEPARQATSPPAAPVEPVEAPPQPALVVEHILEAPNAIALSAPININAYPWAQIEIDGRALGETPMGELRLPRGGYELRAVFADGSSQSRHIQADGNERFIVFGAVSAPPESR